MERVRVIGCMGSHSTVSLSRSLSCSLSRSSGGSVLRRLIGLSLSLSFSLFLSLSLCPSLSLSAISFHLSHCLPKGSGKPEDRRNRGSLPWWIGPSPDAELPRSQELKIFNPETLSPSLPHHLPVHGHVPGIITRSPLRGLRRNH